jgi:hypothetical protein
MLESKDILKLGLGGMILAAFCMTQLVSCHKYDSTVYRKLQVLRETEGYKRCVENPDSVWTKRTYWAKECEEE